MHLSALNSLFDMQIAGDERFSKVIQTLKQKAKLEEPVSCSSKLLLSSKNLR